MLWYCNCNHPCLYFFFFPRRKWRVWACFYPWARRCYFSFGFWWKESGDALWSTRESTTHIQVWHIFVCLLIAVLFSQLISVPFITNISQSPVLVFFSWYINGSEVDAEADYRYSLIDGNLIITNASEITDYGKYQCKAENSFGTVLGREALLQFACE